MKHSSLFLAVLLMMCADTSRGYPVGRPLSLENLVAEADIIFKGTAISTKPVQDEWFNPYADFVAQETEFKVLSVLKGDQPGETLPFRHYDESPSPQGREFQPQFYHFQIGRSYIVFAKKADSRGIFRQIWPYHKGKEDQGALLCLDDKPVRADNVKSALWDELMAMLKSASVNDMVYSIRQLDQMSGGVGAFDGTQDYERMNVLTAVRPLMIHRESKVAQAAIVVVGSNNPYLSDERTQFWLATVGAADTPGISKMDPKLRNLGGELYWKDLAAIADSKVSVETRAMAIRALGLVREAALRKEVDRWVVNQESVIRASAALLLADHPGADATRQLMSLAGDVAAEVRVCVARSAGFAQQVELADTLAKLLTDKETKVREAAAMSLLSFSPKKEAIARIFRANLSNKEFEPLFLNALARDNQAVPRRPGKSGGGQD